MNATGIVKAVSILLVEALVPLGIGWWVAHSTWRLWVRWLLGATAYVVYSGVAGTWLPVMWSGLVIATFAAMFNGIILGVRSVDLHLSRIEVLERAWVAFAAIPAMFFLIGSWIVAALRAAGRGCRERRVAR